MPRYAKGHLFFERDGAILAARFDMGRLTFAAEPVRVLEDVYKNPFGNQVGYDVSRAGTLVYLSARDLESNGFLVWVDREGKETPAVSGMRAYRAPPRLSPDGRQLAITTVGPPHVWIVDMERGSHRRLSINVGYPPVWSADGESVFFSSFIGLGLPVLVSRPADASEDARQLAVEAASRYPEAASPDGKCLLVKQRGSSLQDWDVACVSLDGNGDGEPLPLLSSEFNELSAAISPDGGLLAFVTDETGQDEVLVTPFPDVGARIPISVEGGTEPVWSPRGDELYFREGGRLMVARRQRGAEFSPPIPLLDDDNDPSAFTTMGGGEGLPSYDVAPDGRFLMMRPGPPVETEIHVVVNWLDELERSLADR